MLLKFLIIVSMLALLFLGPMILLTIFHGCLTLLDKVYPQFVLEVDMRFLILDFKELYKTKFLLLYAAHRSLIRDFRITLIQGLSLVVRFTSFLGMRAKAC